MYIPPAKPKIENDEQFAALIADLIRRAPESEDVRVGLKAIGGLMLSRDHLASIGWNGDTDA